MDVSRKRNPLFMLSCFEYNHCQLSQVLKIPTVEFSIIINRYTTYIIIQTISLNTTMKDRYSTQKI